MSQQQTVLRVETNIPDTSLSEPNVYQFTFLDLYGDIPIKINKSFAELQDIAKKNSDYSIGLTLPGSKKNNRFFEDFYNVDAQTLYFNPTERVNCSVLLNDEVYFRGYLRLNKINVINSKVEYDVTLYSTVGNLFGEIGNNLLKDLNFDDTEYTFNHTFSLNEVTDFFGQSNFFTDGEKPYPYFYPVVHNGYNYTNVTGTTGGTSNVYLPNFSGNTTGATLLDQTRLYTSTSPIGSWSTLTGATAAGAQEYRINSPIYGLRDNQLKPALSIWSLIQLIFKTYGYKIKSDFMNTPWMKSLYQYGYFSYEGTKFGWKVNSIQQLPLEGVQMLYDYSLNAIVVVKSNTGIPCYALEDINFGLTLTGPPPFYTPQFQQGVIPAGTSGLTVSITGTYEFLGGNVLVSYVPLRYTPKAVGDSQTYVDGDAVDFSLVIDQNIKQIDILSSIAKKFNLIFIPDPDVPNQIIVEPYDFYVGTGNIYDWTPYLSWDKGFTVEPALNYIESTLLLTDLEDGDEGNRIFKNETNRIYGQNNVYNPTDFKSQDKKIDTIFSPELIRKWDENIGLPLGINYAASNQADSDGQVRWSYKGVKTKPKLFYWLGTANPFIDNVGEVYSIGTGYYDTYNVKVSESLYTGSSVGGVSINVKPQIPVISHTMPIGISDADKINNDSLSILFNSELPVDIGIQTYNVYTSNDVYNVFYRNRINNIYDPNTRFISGYFDLKYSDIQNLQWNDIIKINEQYFTINKINEFNLTNRELTKVELIQVNLNPQEYPTRYFKYVYCDNLSVCYKLKTDFTNPNLQDTNFIWSVFYDQQVGSLTGQTSGFTSTFRVFDGEITYVPYTMNEITQVEYETGGCIDFTGDTLMNYIYTNPNGLQYSIPSLWESNNYTGTNVWNNCADFYTTASTYGIRFSSFTLIGPQLGLISRSYDYGKTWNNITTLPSNGWDGGVAVSYNGKYQTVARKNGLRYVSNDYGSTFTSIATTREYRDVAMSNDGQYQFICVGGQTAGSRDYIYRSIDYGVTWSSNLGPLGAYDSITCDNTGRIVFATTFSYNISPPNGFIAYSTNYGGTWNTSSSVENAMTIRMSKDSKYIAIAVQFMDIGIWPGVYVSSNSGSTFTQTLIMTGDTNSNNRCSMSYSGQYMLYSGDNYTPYLSSNYGATWTALTSITTPAGTWRTQGVSPSGKYMILYTDYNDSIYRSEDFGVTWTVYPDTGSNLGGTPFWTAMN